MPTYSYACKQCDHQFDQVQNFHEPALTDCPQCAGQLRKLFGSVGVVFKGSGFYRTDSRAAKRRATGSTSGQPKVKEETASSKSSDSAKTESSPASKANGQTKVESSQQTKAAAPAAA
ncbi:MAG: FmdB family transcriptional regulator [Micrococcales bacterium]|nr:FmdB family transcriptional regulator [Micrococcales bacterium]